MICSRVRPSMSADHGRRGHLDQHDVIEADLVERVLQRDAALDLVGLDHRGEHVAHGQRRLPSATAVRESQSADGEDAAEVVGRVAPLGGQPGVVEVEPADHGADVEGGLHRDRAGNWCPARLAPLGTTVPGTIGPSSLVQAGYSSASRPQPSVSIRQLRAVA